jgi:DNA-binding NarL/FixJ family response regulator
VERILFVDDERPVLTGLKRRLRQKADSWDMQFIDSPERAIEIFGEKEVSVVVADMAMPGMSGLEMIKAMQELSPTTRFLMLTGTADLQTAMDAINEAGVFRFYTKPADTTLLIEGVEQALADRSETEVEPDKVLPGNDINQVGIAALNHLNVGVIVTDSEARVRFANSMGGILLSEQDGLTLSASEVCRSSNVDETQALHDLIRVACSGATDTDSPALSLSRPSGKRPLAVVVLPIGSNENDDRAADTNIALASLFVSDPERRPPPPPLILEKHLDVSPAEARLVSALAQGQSMDDAAASCGVTVATARSYLKQVFAKTGTKRQAELVKLVMTSPGINQDT